MLIRYWGHASFSLETEDGILLIDPYDESVGYPIPDCKPHILTVSHDHYDHSAVDLFPAAELVKRDGEKTEYRGFGIRAVKTFHDDQEGKLRGDNLFFIYSVEELQVAHCGDLGHILSDEQVKEIGPVDILFLPIGGTYTLDHNTAEVVRQQLKPKITIPMHFYTPVLKFNLQTLDPFLDLQEQYIQYPGNEWQVTKDSLDKYPPVVVLTPPLTNSN